MTTLADAIGPAQDWWDRAACKGVDTEAFFPPSDEQDPLVLLICAECPVIGWCAADALANGDRWGIRAGVRLNPNRIAAHRGQLRAIAGITQERAS